jgi:drug/metabolite transporter (DMT)-like permease
MSTSVMLIVLFGALLHASWNAIIKSSDNKLMQAGLVAGGGALVSLPILPFVPAISTGSIPWLIGSIVIHQFYFFFIAAAYRAGDMGHTYPIMRGTAPMVVALVSSSVVGEFLSPFAWAGVVLICGGILLLSISKHADRDATIIALCNAVVIATYTLVDGLGARQSGAPITYTLYLHVFAAPTLLIWLFWKDAPAMRQAIKTRGLFGLAGGAASLVSYGAALFAMTLAPLATVAALRETSVIFAVAISSLLLGERDGRLRLVAALVVAAGAATLRLS